MGVEETDDALLPPPKVGKAVSSLAPCHGAPLTTLNPSELDFLESDFSALRLGGFSYFQQLLINGVL